MTLETSQTKSNLPRTTGIEARRERQRQEARRTILDAAEFLLVHSDGGDFSIRSLAEKCGYSAPTIYHHFGDKEGVLTALLEEALQALVLQLATCQGGSALDRLRSILLTFIRYATSHPTFSGLLGSVSSHPGAEMPPAFEEVKEHLDAPVRELIQTGQFGEFDTTSAEQVLWALLHGLIALQTAEPDHPWAPGLAERAVDSLLRGMATPAERATR